MPCRYDMPPDYIEYRTPPEVQGELDRVTQLLCYSVGEFKRMGHEMPKELEEWADKHHKCDDLRVQATISLMYDKGLSKPEVLIHLIHEAEKVHPLSDFHRNWFFDMVSKHYPKTKGENKCSSK
jgi:hypothetical protein